MSEAVLFIFNLLRRYNYCSLTVSSICLKFGNSADGVLENFQSIGGVYRAVLVDIGTFFLFGGKGDTADRALKNKKCIGGVYASVAVDISE